MIVSKIENGKKNIILIGMPGVGKTTIGRLLAEQNAMSFVDTDDYIEKKSGMRIPDIFRQYGIFAGSKPKPCVTCSQATKQQAML